MRLSQFCVALILGLAMAGGLRATGNGQMPTIEGFQAFVNAATGCYERHFTGEEPQRTVPAAQVIEAVQHVPCVVIGHALIEGALDFTALPQSPGMTIRSVRASIQIEDSELQAIKAGVLGDSVTTLFVAPVSFEGSQVRGKAEFVNAVFASSANFRGADFAATASFNGVRFESAADFSNAKFEQLAYLFGTRFAKEALFAQTQFDSAVRFFNARFLSEANFQGATFASTVDLSNSRYADRAVFTEAHFARAATAKNIEFARSLRFDGVRVDDAIDFSNTRIGGEAAFNRIVIGGARFFGVRFAQGADFTTAHFTTEASFNSALFGGLTSYLGATFDQSVVFSNTIFLGEALFTQAKFAGDVDFSMARFAANLGPDFLGAEFGKALNLENTVSAGAWRLTWAQVKGKLAPETPQILGLLEKSFAELRQGEDAVAACEANANLQKEKKAAMLRCALLGPSLGAPLKLPELGEPAKKVSKPEQKQEKVQKQRTGVPGVVLLVAGLLAGFLIAKLLVH